MQRRYTITTATLAGVSANITRPSIHLVYAKYANDGYLLLPASARGQRAEGPLVTRLTTPRLPQRSPAPRDLGGRLDAVRPEAGAAVNCWFA